jgi:hypothetical protein
MKRLQPKLCAVIILLLCYSHSTGQSAYYQASVYFSSGVTRHITATDTSAIVTASDIQTVLTPILGVGWNVKLSRY